MKWSEQMRNLESADQVYNECIIDMSVDETFKVMLNGKNINICKAGEKTSMRVSTKYAKLFKDPLFIKNILCIKDYEYNTVDMFYTEIINKNIFRVNVQFYGSQKEWIIYVSDIEINQIY